MRSWTLLLSILVACPAWGDAVVLNDGTRIEGQIKREGLGWTITDASGKVTRVGDDQVKMVEKTGNLTPEQLASADLDTLRRWMEDVTDPKVAVEHYQKFIERNSGKPVAADAGKDLQTWKDRQANGMTRLGARWVTPKERQEALAQIASIADDVKSTIEAGRLKEARESLKRIFAIDPDSPTGLYLQGVIDYRQKQHSTARKDFERAAKAMKDHGPTLNNLAVVEFQQNARASALDTFDHAMQALPKNRQILDNVAESLHELPDSEQNSALAKRVASRFQEQDAALQKQLKADDLVRWGATYITKDQMAEIQTALDKIKTKVDDLTSQLKKDQTRLNQIDKQIDDNNRRAANPRNRNRVQYTDQNNRLKAERGDLVSKMQSLQQQLQQLEQQAAPYPKYPGPLKVFGPEMAPVDGGKPH